MKITLHKSGRRFNREWIFRNIDYEFLAGNHYAITGANGSGKSTLMLCLSGQLSLSEGTLTYLENDSKLVEASSIFRNLSLCSPAVELPGEFTLKEFLQFHFSLKKPIKGISIDEIPTLLNLQKSVNKELRLYSSGMRQRVKLAATFFADVPLLLLDEPTTNLDLKGIDWYHKLVEDYAQNRTIIVSSNQQHEYSFCKEILQVEDYKR